MCGIVGVVGRNDVVPSLMSGLRRLEYRGYDSAGVAVLNGQIDRRRAVGKLNNLERKLMDAPLAGLVGIGHTRWATHGGPCETNAHPITTGRVSVVHNGIVENYRALRDRLRERGYPPLSETDTECIAGLMNLALDDGLDPEQALVSVLTQLKGAFAFAALIAGREDRLFCARHHSTLAIGYGDDAMYVCSDALALAPLTQRISYLDDGDSAVLTTGGAKIFDVDLRSVVRPIRVTSFEAASDSKAEYRHYMEKEIHEQPAVIDRILATFRDRKTGALCLPELPFDLGSVTKITIIACGTSHCAAMVARYWIEDIAGLPVDTDIASEFRYRHAPRTDGELALVISQSGETADTLACLQHLKAEGRRTLAIVNRAESSIAREADAAIITPAGPEIGVAATKTFTAQLALLFFLAIGLARSRSTIGAEEEAGLLAALAAIPAKMRSLLADDREILRSAALLNSADDAIYLGRGTSYPLALEGALKLKEISYIHAEGFAAGEMKHGPIALIDSTVPVVAIAPSDGSFGKTASNLQEVLSRGGRIVLISDAAGLAAFAGPAHPAIMQIEMPECPPAVAPLLYAIPVQLLAYHTACLRDNDVDQPRNLAKSVTVE